MVPIEKVKDIIIQYDVFRITPRGRGGEGRGGGYDPGHEHNLWN